MCVCVCAEPVKARNLQLERQDVVGPKTIFFMPCHVDTYILVLLKPLL